MNGADLAPAQAKRLRGQRGGRRILRRTVSCIACGSLFINAHSLRAHWTGGLQPLWMRALRARKEGRA